MIFPLRLQFSLLELKFRNLFFLLISFLRLSTNSLHWAIIIYFHSFLLCLHLNDKNHNLSRKQCSEVIHYCVTSHKKKKVRQQFIVLTCLNYSQELIPIFPCQNRIWISQWFISNLCAKHCSRHTRQYLIIPVREILKLQILGLQMCHMLWSGCRVQQKFCRRWFYKLRFSSTEMLQDTQCFLKNAGKFTGLNTQRCGRSFAVYQSEIGDLSNHYCSLN